MKSGLIVSLSGLVLAATTTFASADITVLGGAMALASDEALEQSADPPAPKGSDRDKEDCKARKLVLPLDHGPRAQTTPYLNQQRKAKFEAEMKRCLEAAPPKMEAAPPKILKGAVLSPLVQGT